MRAIGLIAASLAWVAASIAYGQAPRVSTEIAKITASDGLYGDGFGASLAAYGDWVVVGAPGYSTAQYYRAGAVYVFRRSGARWIEQAQLFAEEQAHQDTFGFSVAIEADTIVIGAPQMFEAKIGGGVGAAYLFRRFDPATPNDPSDDLWLQDAKLTSPDELRTGDKYGYAVSISQGTVIIGRPGWDYSSGSAYLYRRIGNVWRHWASLNPSDSANLDQFGSAVAISGDTALIGAYGKSDAGFRSGAAYIFRQSGDAWVEQRKLTASDAAAHGFFGVSVGLSSDHAVVGGHGKAYAYPEGVDHWSEEINLTPNQRGLNFGDDVDANRNWIAVGDPTYGPGFDGLGAVYLFTRDQIDWELDRQFLASDPTLSAHVGFRLTLQRNYLFANGRSSVYVFVLPDASMSLADFAAFQSCFGGVHSSMSPECTRFDRCGGAGLDPCDLNELLATFVGP